MPRPLGRDRLEPTADGTTVLLSLHPKPWNGRESVSPRAPVVPGTAIRWDGELFEVLSIEARPAGGFRHILAPWDDRFLVRKLVEYGSGDGTGAGGPPSGSVSSQGASSLAPPPAAATAYVSEGEAASSNQAPEGGTRFEAAPAGPVAPPDAVLGSAPSLRHSPAAVAPGGVAAAWRALSPAMRALAVAFVPSVLFGWFFPFRVMGEGISFLVHELGHTLVAWFFGCSALPAIVMTVVFAQNRAVAAIVWGGLAFLAVKYRHARRWNVAFVALAVLYPLVAFTNAHVTAFDLGGHLAELAFAAWAFGRAVRGERAEWERPVWAFFAFYLVARNVRLFGGVALSASARTDYQTVAIAGQNDIVKVAATTGLPLPALAALNALLFLVVPLGALALALRAPAEGERELSAE